MKISEIWKVSVIETQKGKYWNERSGKHGLQPDLLRIMQVTKAKIKTFIFKCERNLCVT